MSNFSGARDKLHSVAEIATTSPVNSNKLHQIADDKIPEEDTNSSCMSPNSVDLSSTPPLPPTGGLSAYVKEHLIGQGRHANVWRGTHVFSKVKVAIKEIDKLKLNSHSQGVIKRECKTLRAGQNHPYIVRLFEIIDTPNFLFLILELGTTDLHRFLFDIPDYGSVLASNTLLDRPLTPASASSGCPKPVYLPLETLISDIGNDSILLDPLVEVENDEEYVTETDEQIKASSFDDFNVFQNKPSPSIPSQRGVIEVRPLSTAPQDYTTPPTPLELKNDMPLNTFVATTSVSSSCSIKSDKLDASSLTSLTPLPSLATGSSAASSILSLLKRPLSRTRRTSGKRLINPTIATGSGIGNAAIISNQQDTGGTHGPIASKTISTTIGRRNSNHRRLSGEELVLNSSFPPPGIPEPEAASYCSAIFSAVFFCHNVLGVAHRDIKLDNVIMFKGNDSRQRNYRRSSFNKPYPIVKLTDFGLSASCGIGTTGTSSNTESKRVASIRKSGGGSGGFMGIVPDLPSLFGRISRHRHSHRTGGSGTDSPMPITIGVSSNSPSTSSTPSLTTTNRASFIRNSSITPPSGVIGPYGSLRRSLESKLRSTPCGTLIFTAPEILTGDRYNAKLADIWSLGVLLYMLVVGRCPFLETNDNETITMIIDCKYSVPSHISPECRGLISKMLVKDPSKRAKLEEILNHPWLTQQNLSTSSTTTTTTTTSTSSSNDNNTNTLLNNNTLASFSRADITDDIHRAIINKMVGGGIGTEHQIKQSLKRDCYNHVTATYYLLAEKMLKYKASHSIGGSHSAANAPAPTTTISTTSSTITPPISTTTNKATLGRLNSGGGAVSPASKDSAKLPGNFKSLGEDEEDQLNMNYNNNNNNVFDNEDNINNIHLLAIDPLTHNTLGAELLFVPMPSSDNNKQRFLNGDDLRNYHNNNNNRNQLYGDLSSAILREENSSPYTLPTTTGVRVVPNYKYPPVVVSHNVSSSSLPELMSSTTPVSFYARDLPPPSGTPGGYVGATGDDAVPSPDQYETGSCGGGTYNSNSPVSDMGVGSFYPKNLLTRQSYDGGGCYSLSSNSCRASPKPLTTPNQEGNTIFFNTYNRSSSPIVIDDNDSAATDNSLLIPNPSPSSWTGGGGGGQSSTPPPAVGSRKLTRFTAVDERPPKSPTLSLGTPVTTFNPLCPPPLHRSSYYSSSSGSTGINVGGGLPSKFSRSSSINSTYTPAFKHGSVDNITNLTNLNQIMHPKHQTPHQYLYTKLLSEEKYPPTLITSSTLKHFQPPPPHLSDKKALPSSTARKISPFYYQGRFSDPTSSSSIPSSSSSATFTDSSPFTSSDRKQLLKTAVTAPSTLTTPTTAEAATDQYSNNNTYSPNINNNNVNNPQDQGSFSSSPFIGLPGSRYLHLLSVGAKKPAAIPSRICEENEPPSDEDECPVVPAAVSGGSYSRSGFKKFPTLYDKYTRGTDLQLLQQQSHHRSNSLTEPTIDQLLNDRLAKIRLYASINSVRSSPNFQTNVTITTTPANLFPSNNTGAITTCTISSNLSPSLLVSNSSRPFSSFNGVCSPTKQPVSKLLNNLSCGSEQPAASNPPGLSSLPTIDENPVSSCTELASESADTKSASLDKSPTVFYKEDKPYFTMGGVIFNNNNNNNNDNNNKTNTVNIKKLPFTSLEEISEED